MEAFFIIFIHCALLLFAVDCRALWGQGRLLRAVTSASPVVHCGQNVAETVFHDPVFMVIWFRRIRWCVPLGMLDYSFIGCFMSVINIEFVTRWPWEKLIFTHEWIVVILFNVGKWTMIKSLASSWDEQCNINKKLLFRKEKVFHPQGFDYTFLLFVFSSSFSRFGNYAYGIPQMNVEIFYNFLIKRFNYFMRNRILLLNFLQVLFLSSDAYLQTGIFLFVIPKAR